jgi:RNA polymerase sigma factor (TIGR02999 family)
VTLQKDVTQLLLRWKGGDRAALDDLMPIVYSELRRLAGSLLRWERPDHTLQPTALIHEAYLRLANQQEVHWQNRSHFFAVASKIMRQILVNHALAHRAAKRGGGRIKVTLNEVIPSRQKQDYDVLALDEALKRLAQKDPRKSQIVELRFFGGLSNEEIVEVMGISLATLHREWRMIKAWLFCELKK